ncbi:MAG: sporulation stage IV protein A, partial [Clostridia bacterium]
FKEAMNRGYGIVNPLMDALTLEDPMIVRQGSKYGVKIKAKAPSVHLIRTDVETEINPFVGTQQQSEDFVNYLNQEMKEEPSKVWDSEIFGKSLYELVNEGLNNKLVKMPEDAQLKLQETLEKVINEGRGGLICIIL